MVVVWRHQDGSIKMTLFLCWIWLKVWWEKNWDKWRACVCERENGWCKFFFCEKLMSLRGFSYWANPVSRIIKVLELVRFGFLWGWFHLLEWGGFVCDDFEFKSEFKRGLKVRFVLKEFGFEGFLDDFSNFMVVCWRFQLSFNRKLGRMVVFGADAWEVASFLAPLMVDNYKSTRDSMWDPHH